MLKELGTGVEPVLRPYKGRVLAVHTNPAQGTSGDPYGIRTRGLPVDSRAFSLPNSWTEVVDQTGFEPITVRVSGGCSNRWSYWSLKVLSQGLEPRTYRL